MSQGLQELRKLEGQNVLVDLIDGSSIGDCMLVSAGRGRTASLWLLYNGDDVFVPFADLMSVSPESRYEGQAA